MLRKSLSCALFACGFTHFALADYPIASHRYLADPCVLVHDGRVYLYCSNDDENVGAQDYLMKSLVCISSDDLKNWTDHGPVFRVPDDASWASRSWAPSMSERHGRFYLYFGNGGSGIGVAVGDSPIGPFTDPLGELLIKWSTPGAAGENMWLFDPYVFIDDDQQAYLYFGGNGESNVRIIKLNEDMISLDGAARSITAPGFFEAAWMHKRDGIYYFSYSTNPSHGLRIDYMTSDNPVSGFEYAGVVADQPPSNNNNNHAGIFQFADSWYHVYHNRYVANQAGDPPGYLRNLGIEPLDYLEDGSIQEISYTFDQLVQVKALDPYGPVQGETFASQSGAETQSIGDGAMALSDMQDGDWIALRGVDFDTGADAFQVRVAGTSGGSIELRLDQIDGPLIGSCTVTPRSSFEDWATQSCSIDPDLASGLHDLYLIFQSDDDTAPFLLDWWQFSLAPLPPDSPQGLSLVPISNSQLQLSWAATPEADSYDIFRSASDQGPFAIIASELIATEYLDQDLSEGIDYHYKVVARNEAGTSDESILVSAQTAPNFQEWVLEHFGPDAPAEVASPEADPDLDGAANVFEYLAGSSPLQASPQQLRLTRLDETSLALSFRKSKHIAWVPLRIELSSDLVNWTRSDLTLQASALDEEFVTLESQILFQSEPLFLRIEANPIEP
ncbi:family 43 glycosylhydrolase [Pelagicoccus sp. SDUM812003]|uniref:family 43 glycosylhydrolase n=1 Tax=Pelagicoccus sp. SDUM812003 TaxID=3041267 RepID=UPI00280F585A|nr:family 43 glycosylhydrolase [Pelagicoccus sp. SDUM812003]MDQ8204035.1 family 43 glycosylhydrolase [Pelagicoccus sp. SDUM812003]